MFLCADCGETRPVQTSGVGTGYGYDKRNRPICYACCGKNDRLAMDKTGRAMLYLTIKPDLGGSYGNAEITNWPGTLRFAGRYHKGNHNIAGSRYDVWFKVDGQNWHGITYGENTQICHCRRVK